MRTRKRELFELIGYAPHPGQVLVHRSRALRRVIASGTRWGKSTCAAGEIVAGLLEPREKSLGWVVAPTFELTQRVWLRVVDLLQGKLSHRVREIIPREQRIIVSNLGGGISELRAKSADQPAGLLGEAVDFLVVDEATKLRDDIWPSYLMPRLIDRRGWSLLISTPEGPGWFFEEYRRGQRNRDPDYESWAMPSWTNPYVSREVIETQRTRLTEDNYRQQFGAEFLDVPRDPCERCGGPREDVPEYFELLPGQDYDDVPRCTNCGMFVDADGRCIVRLRNAWHASLDLDAGEEVAMYQWQSPKADGNWTPRKWRS